MKYKVVINNENDTKCLVIKEFTENSDAIQFMNQLNDNIRAFYRELNVNHGWSDWKIEEFFAEHLGKYECSDDLWYYMDAYDKQTVSYIKED